MDLKNPPRLSIFYYWDISKDIFFLLCFRRGIALQDSLRAGSYRCPLPSPTHSELRCWLDSKSGYIDPRLYTLTAMLRQCPQRVFGLRTIPRHPIIAIPPPYHVRVKEWSPGYVNRLGFFSTGRIIARPGVTLAEYTLPQAWPLPLQPSISSSPSFHGFPFFHQTKKESHPPRRYLVSTLHLLLWRYTSSNRRNIREQAVCGAAGMCFVSQYFPPLSLSFLGANPRLQGLNTELPLPVITVYISFFLSPGGEEGRCHRSLAHIAFFHMDVGWGFCSHQSFLLSRGMWKDGEEPLSVLGLVETAQSRFIYVTGMRSKPGDVPVYKPGGWSVFFLKRTSPGFCSGMESYLLCPRQILKDGSMPESITGIGYGVDFYFSVSWIPERSIFNSRSLPKNNGGGQRRSENAK